LNLVIEENRYQEAIKAINTRSLHHFKAVQPKLEKARIKEGEKYTIEQLRNALGDSDYLNLQRLTDAIVLHVDRTTESLVAMKTQLRKTLLQQYPKGKFIDFDLLKEPPKSIFL